MNKLAQIIRIIIGLIISMYSFSQMYMPSTAEIIGYDFWFLLIIFLGVFLIYQSIRDLRKQKI